MKTTRKEPFVMNAVRLGLAGVVTIALIAIAPACFESDQDACGAGLVADTKSSNCVAPPPPAPDASASDGGASEAGGEGGPSTEDFFGKTCATAGECGGNAPLCAAPQLPYCTQINCSAGEPNAGACPATGWTCLPAANGNPSACLKQ